MTSPKLSSNSRVASPPKLSIIGAGLEGTGAVLGAAEGPDTLRRSPLYSEFFSDGSWGETHVLRGTQSKDPNKLRDYLAKVGQSVHNAFLLNKKPLVYSGDHTAAVGTWSGMRLALEKGGGTEGRLGLMWIDAHMDAHTPQTSTSGNWHGMPLAILMGHGGSNFTQLLSPTTPKILPENIVLMGARSYEDEEKALLDKLGVRVICSKEIGRRSFSAALEEALWVVNNNTVGYGISFDLDVLNPREAPGVGTPIEDGLGLEETLKAIRDLDKSRLLAAEVAEFNPSLDSEQKTERAALEIAHALTTD